MSEPTTEPPPVRALPPHPSQPLVRDAEGKVRFRANAIVRHLLDKGGINLNDLAGRGFDAADWEQFYQLIGYSIDGFSELTWCVRDGVYERAEAECRREFPGYFKWERPAGWEPCEIRDRARRGADDDDDE